MMKTTKTTQTTKNQIVKQISTHKAIKENGQISIYIKGLIIDGEEIFKDELLYNIPLKNKDDLFAIFERFQEDNRINLNEFNF